MAITTAAQVRDANPTIVRFYKSVLSGSSSSYFVSSWRANNLPVAGTEGPSYLVGSGYTYSKASTGAAQFRNATVANYIRRITLSPPQPIAANTNIIQFELMDRLWACSGMGFLAATYTCLTPGSLPARITDSGVGCEIWFSGEGGASVPTGNLTVNYLDTTGASKATPTISLTGFAASAANDAFKIPLAVGSLGVSQIVSVVTGSSWTSGTFGVFVAKPIFSAPVPSVNYSITWPWTKTGLVSLHDDTCLFYMLRSSPNNGTTSSILNLEIVDL